MMKPGDGASPAAGRWRPRLRDVVVVLVASVMVAGTVHAVLPFNADLAGSMFGDLVYDPQGPEQVRDQYAGETSHYLTSGQWVGLSVALAAGVVLMLGHGRVAPVLPLALFAGTPLALAQAVIAVPAGLDHLDALYAAGPEFGGQPVPPPPWDGLGYSVVIGFLGFPLSAGLGAAAIARHRPWSTMSAMSVLWLIAWCPTTALLI